MDPTIIRNLIYSLKLYIERHPREFRIRFQLFAIGWWAGWLKIEMPGLCLFIRELCFFFFCPVDVIHESNGFTIQEYDGL
jgi:hypothetical protein